jgi:hypothetical protein
MQLRCHFNPILAPINPILPPGGSPFSAFIDQYFGTFRERLGKSSEYKGGSDDRYEASTQGVAKEEKTMVQWSPQGYLGLPASWDHGAYALFCSSLGPLAYWGFIANKRADGTRVTADVAGIPVEHALAVGIAVLPVAVALILCRLAGDRMSMRWPFHKEPVVGAFGLFVLLGTLACVVPMYHATLWSC